MRWWQNKGYTEHQFFWRVDILLQQPSMTQWMSIRLSETVLEYLQWNICLCMRNWESIYPVSLVSLITVLPSERLWGGGQTVRFAVGYAMHSEPNLGAKIRKIRSTKKWYKAQVGWSEVYNENRHRAQDWPNFFWRLNQRIAEKKMNFSAMLVVDIEQIHF